MNFMFLRYCFLVFVAITAVGTIGVASSTTSYLPTPCTNYASGVRPVPSATAVVTKDQIVFDLCRAAFEIAGNGKTESRDDTQRRLRTIAAEGRLITVCVAPRPSFDPKTDTNYIAHHEPGCGPAEKGTTPPIQAHSQENWSTACSKMGVNARPVSLLLGMHGPITAAQVAFDTCYLANTINTSDEVDQEGRLSPEILHLLDKLEYEYELVGRSYGPAPSQADTDYALERQFGCGTYPCPPASPELKPSP